MDTRAIKAKQLRYKKPISRNLNLEAIKLDLWEMEDKCSDIHWYDGDEESLVNALDGDEDDAYEFKMAFCDLEADLDRFREELEDIYVSDYFDTLFPAAGADYEGGYLGYDPYEGDYFGLDPYQYELAETAAAKKMMSLTKKELLEVMGICLKVAQQYMAVRYRYDCLDAAIETLRGANMERIKAVKGVEEWYEKAEESSHHFEFEFGKEVAEFNRQLEQIPQEYWVA